MTVWIDLVKMVAISSLLSLLLCIIAVLLAGGSERLFLLVTPTPKWPVFCPVRRSRRTRPRLPLGSFAKPSGEYDGGRAATYVDRIAF